MAFLFMEQFRFLGQACYYMHTYRTLLQMFWALMMDGV